jgi:hypothetical protein
MELSSLPPVFPVAEPYEVSLFAANVRRTW